jgi:hypothetical protein
MSENQWTARSRMQSLANWIKYLTSVGTLVIPFTINLGAFYQ